MVSVGGKNGDWSLCAAKCSEDADCQGWTYVYNGSPGASSFQCWLKPNLESTDYTQWVHSDDDISGLRKEQSENCPNDVCTEHNYTGFHHKDSGSPDGQWNDPVDGTNDDWWRCAEKCSHNETCQGWTFVYDGSPGASSFQCWLKPNLESTDHTQWVQSDDDISGLHKAELQLQGQLENCPNDFCTDHGYTGYDHHNSDGSEADQRTETVDNNEWWKCADKCSQNDKCQGWTLVYNGLCYLKGTLSSTDPSKWRVDDNVISGLREFGEPSR
jgi:hypothetical protein